MSKLKKESVKISSLNLGEAYDLVIADLFSKLIKFRERVIKLGELGTLHKKEREIRSPGNGKVYVYYQISFKASEELKKELDK